MREKSEKPNIFAQRIIEDDPLVVMCWSPDGRFIATGSASGQILIWDTTSWEPISSLSGGTERFWSLSWSSQGYLALLDAQGELMIWCIDHIMPVYRQVLSSLDQDYNFLRPTYAVWSPQGDRLALCVPRNEGGTVCVLERETWRCLREWYFHPGIRYLSWSPNGRLLAGSDSEATMIILDTQTGIEVACSSCIDGDDLLPTLSFSQMIWSPSDPVIIATCSSGPIVFWNYKTGERVDLFGEKQEHMGLGRSVFLGDMAWGTDGALLLACKTAPPPQLSSAVRCIPIIFPWMQDTYSIIWSMKWSAEKKTMVAVGESRSGAVHQRLSYGFLLVWDMTKEY